MVRTVSSSGAHLIRGFPDCIHSAPTAGAIPGHGQFCDGAATSVGFCARGPAGSEDIPIPEIRISLTNRGQVWLAMAQRGRYPLLESQYHNRGNETIAKLRQSEYSTDNPPIPGELTIGVLLLPGSSMLVKRPAPHLASVTWKRTPNIGAQLSTRPVTVQHYRTIAPSMHNSCQVALGL